MWKNIRQLILDSIQHCECVDNNASLTWSSDPTYGQKWIDVVNMIQSYKKDSPRYSD